jgi:CUB/sushi domain-containing protein
MCTGVDCGSLLSPTNGQIIISSTTFGSTASYSCSSGYNLAGATVRICQASGQWSGTAPVCVPVTTSSAPPPATQQPPPSPTGTES